MSLGIYAFGHGGGIPGPAFGNKPCGNTNFALIPLDGVGFGEYIQDGVHFVDICDDCYFVREKRYQPCAVS